jgi:hypothetical protein
MRAFITALIIFAALLALILCNAAFVKRATGELEVILDGISLANRSAQAAALETAWQRHRRWISFSVSFKELSAFDRCVAELRREHWENEAELEAAVVAAKCAAQDLGRLEALSVENIF